MKQSEYWTWQEVCRALQISSIHLYALIQRRQFPRPARVCGTIRYWRPSRIRAWQQQRRMGIELVPPAGYSTGQVARHLGVARRTVIQWIEQGTLPAYQLPGSRKRRIAPRDLRDFAQRFRLPLAVELCAAAQEIALVDNLPYPVLQACRQDPQLQACVLSPFELGVQLARYRAVFLLHDPALAGALCSAAGRLQRLSPPAIIAYARDDEPADRLPDRPYLLLPAWQCSYQGICQTLNQLGYLHPSPSSHQENKNI